MRGDHRPVARRRGAVAGRHRTELPQLFRSAPSSARVEDVVCAASRLTSDASHESLASAGGNPLARRARRAHHHHPARADGHGCRRRHHGGTGKRDRARWHRPRRQSVLAADAVDVRDRDGRDAVGLAIARRRAHRRRRRRRAPGAMDRGVRRRDGRRAAAVRGARVSPVGRRRTRDPGSHGLSARREPRPAGDAVLRRPALPVRRHVLDPTGDVYRAVHACHQGAPELALHPRPAGARHPRHGRRRLRLVDGYRDGLFAGRHDRRRVGVKGAGVGRFLRVFPAGTGPDRTSPAAGSPDRPGAVRGGCILFGGNALDRTPRGRYGRRASDRVQHRRRLVHGAPGARHGGDHPRRVQRRRRTISPGQAGRRGWRPPPRSYGASSSPSPC